MEDLTAVYDAYMGSIERALGVRPGLLYRLDPASVKGALTLYKKGQK